MVAPEDITIRSLRSNIALQIARALQRSDETQTIAAQRLGIPQPTLSKIVNARVHDLSIELLLRVAVRAGLALTLQTGRDGPEAGVFVTLRDREKVKLAGSTLAIQARESSNAFERRLSVPERLEAFLQHNQLVNEFHEAGRTAEQKRPVGRRTPE